MDVALYAKKIMRKMLTGSAEPFVPERMHKKYSGIEDLISIKDPSIPLLFNSPVVICGAVINNKPNFNTLSNFGIVSLRGPIVCISTNSENYTNFGIREHQQFSIGFPCVAILDKVAFCGTVSGHVTSKATVFRLKYGELPFAPVSVDCMVSFTCRVSSHETIGKMDVFFGEVTEKFAQSEYVVENQLDFQKIKPLCVGPGAVYRVVDRKVGTPWSDYKKVY